MILFCIQSEAAWEQFIKAVQINFFLIIIYLPFRFRFIIINIKLLSVDVSCRFASECIIIDGMEKSLLGFFSFILLFNYSLLQH